MKAIVEMDCGSNVVLVFMPESKANLDDVAWRAVLSFGENKQLAESCAKHISEMRWNELQLFELHKKYNVKNIVVSYDWECHNTGLATFHNIQFKEGGDK